MPLMHSGTITSNVWPEWTLYLTIRHMARDLGYSQFKVSPVPVPSGAGLELGNEMMRPEGKFSVMLPLGKRSYHCANNRQMKCIFPLLKAVLNHHPGPILPVTELRLVLLSVKTPTSNENKTWEQLPHLGLFQQQLVCPRTGNCHLVLESNLGYYDPWNTITKDTDTFWSLVECWGFQETLSRLPTPKVTSFATSPMLNAHTFGFASASSPTKRLPTLKYQVQIHFLHFFVTHMKVTENKMVGTNAE